MQTKLDTDHVGERGCRSALNVDTVRAILVCETAADLVAVLGALGEEFAGCGRVKSGFDARDASAFFELRTLLANVVVDAGLTYADLARAHGNGAWLRHAESSMPEGGAPRKRWRDEARAAREILMSAELAAVPVRYIGEVQLMLADVYHVRAHMHEIYKCYRADDDKQLHADMVGETLKAAKAKAFAADGSTPLRRAARDGDVKEARRLLSESSRF